MIRAGDLGLVLRMLVSTMVVLSLLLLFARAAKKGKLNGFLQRFGGGVGKSSSERVTVLERHAVSRESMIAVLEFDGEEILVAVGNSGGSVLARRRSGKTEEKASFEAAMREARTDTDVENAVAAGLPGTSALERLRAATSRRETKR